MISNMNLSSVSGLPFAEEDARFLGDLCGCAVLEALFSMAQGIEFSPVLDSNSGF